jgi:hypothetical protein
MLEKMYLLAEVLLEITLVEMSLRVLRIRVIPSFHAFSLGLENP